MLNYEIINKYEYADPEDRCLTNKEVNMKTLFLNIGKVSQFFK